MWTRIGIAAGLTLVTTAVLAAGGIEIGLNSPLSARAQFNALDANDDGVISPIEAQASPKLALLYDTFNTAETIEDEARRAAVNGMTWAQFRAGLQALGDGVVGPAVSGGGRYVVMQDGSTVALDVFLQHSTAGY